MTTFRIRPALSTSASALRHVLGICRDGLRHATRIARRLADLRMACSISEALLRQNELERSSSMRFTGAPQTRFRRCESSRCAAPHRADDADQQTRADEPSNQVADPSAPKKLKMALAIAAPTTPSAIFNSNPVSLFMNCSASQPAIPPMIMAATNFWVSHGSSPWRGAALHPARPCAVMVNED